MFAIFADIHEKDISQALEWCNNNHIMSVYTVGDNVDSADQTGTYNTYQKKWQEKIISQFDRYMDIFPYFALGNHDIYKSRSMGILAYNIMSHEERIYYQAIEESSHIDLFILDTSSEHVFSGQMEWLEKALQNSTATYKLVLGHHPIDDIDEKAALYNLFETYGVDAYFHGHYHTYEYEDKNGIYYINCPQTAIPADDTAGFVTIRISGDCLIIEIRDMNGVIFDQISIKAIS